ncbi:MAG TPA: lipoate--protein ligase family protein [Nocardioidaceae bacterium]|nr:lipoate--protein ligase family protein [Nocardioidaceae bacterium]
MTTRLPPADAGTVFVEDRPLGDPRADVALGPILLRAGIDDAAEIIRIYTPRPTAAFSRRDSRQPGFRVAVQAADAAGFAPVVRGPGGRLAAYHGGSLVIDHIVRGSDAPSGMVERFELYSELHARVLGELGLDARVGELDGEYCPGAYSVNVAGVSKVIGSAQRITRDGWMFSTVIQVTGSGSLREVLRATHQALGYPLDPVTVGTLEDFAPDVTSEAVAGAFRRLYATGREDAPAVRLPGAVLAEARAAAGALRGELGRFSSP